MKRQIPKFPHVLRIEPSAKCNFMCSHCPTGTIEMTRNLMNDSTFNNITKNLLRVKDSIKVVVMYHGGEPFLNKNFFDYLKQIKKIKKSFFVKTVSNGSALTNKLIDKILNSNLDSIEFSLDGISSTEIEYVRIKSNTSKIIKNIKLLLEKKEVKKSKLNILISSTQFLRKKVHDNEEVPLLSPPDWLKKIFLDKVEYKTFYALKWPHMDVLNNYDLMYSIGEEKDDCDNVNSTITVRSDGSVVACCFDLTSKIVLGNINDNTLIEIWNNDKYTNLRNSIKQKKFISICKNCSNVKPPVYLIPKWNIETFIKYKSNVTI